MRGLALTWTLGSGYRIEIANQAEWCVFNDLFVEGEYDRAIDATIAAVRDEASATIVDLGANVGFFALRFMDRWQRGQPGATRLRLFLIEGSPVTCAELRRRVAQLRSPGVEIEIVHGLVGEREGDGWIEQEISHLGSHVVADAQTSHAECVPYVDLDTLVPGPIALIKCDIEGSENALIKNYPALLTRTARAVFEFHHWIRPAAESLHEVHALGFDTPECLRETANYSTHYFVRKPSTVS